MEKYGIIRSLGDGTFGHVSLAQNKDTGEYVAIKKMKRKFYTWEECTSLKEVKTLQRLGHPNVIRLKEVIRVSNELYLIFEHMQASVYELLKSSKGASMVQSGLSERVIKSIIYQCLLGLHFIHTHGVYHRDLKPENILYSMQ
jgi:serine/threonine protein kinase